jgi:hypothetical protein
MDKGEPLATSIRTTSSARSKAVARPSSRPIRGAPNGRSAPVAGAKPEPKIIFQRYFKSIGSRTYAVQVKQVANGNHLLVLTEGKRDPETNEVRKSRVFVYGEDFISFFRQLHETAAFMRANPVPEEVRSRREKFWAKKNREARQPSQPPTR